MAPNTIEILTSINKSVLQIVNNMSHQNTSSVEGVAKLNRGGSEVVNKPETETGINIKTDSIPGIVKVLGMLSPAVTDVAKLSGSQIRRFKKVIAGIAESITNLAESKDADKAKEKIKAISELSSLGGLATSITNLSNVSNAKIKSFKKVMEALCDVVGYLSEHLKTVDAKKLDTTINAIDKAFMSAHKMMVRLVTWIPLAPLALVGALLATPVFLAVAGLFKLIQIIKIGEGATKSLESMSNSLNLIAGFVLKMIFVSTLLMGLGYLLMNTTTSKFILGGLMMFAAVTVVSISVLYLTKLAGNIVGETGMKSLKEIVGFVLGMSLVVGVMVLFGALMKNNMDVVWKGFLMFITACVAMVAVVGVAVLAGKISEHGIKSMGKMIMFTVASMLVVVAAKYLGDFVIANWQGVVAGLVSVGAVLAGLVGIAIFANKSKETTLKGIGVLALVSLLAVAALGIVFGALKLSEQAKGKWGDITISLLAVGGVILSFVGLAVAATAASAFIAPGAAALLLVSAFAISSVYLVEKIIDFHNIKEKSGLKWSDIDDNVSHLNSVIGSFGKLAAKMGLVAPFILLGTAASASLILFVMSSVDIANRVLDMRQRIVEAKADWKSINGDVLNLSSVISTFAKLGTSMSVALPFILLGTASMMATKKFVKDAVGIISELIILHDAIEKVGGSQKIKNTVTKDMAEILGVLTNTNLKLPLSLGEIASLKLQYMGVTSLVSSFIKVGCDLSKLATIVGIVDDQGRISPVLSIDEKTGDIKYGAPADIKAIANLIVDTIRVFTTNLSDGIGNVSDMRTAKRVMKLLAKIIDPVNTFIDMLTGYESGGSGDNMTLASITVNEKGEVVVGKHVNVKQVATIISNTVSTFVSTLFSDANREAWERMIYGDGSKGSRRNARRQRKATEKIMGVLGTVVEPITGFIDMLTVLDTEDGKLRRVSISEDGTIKEGKLIDVVKVATTISSSVSTFMGTLFSKDNVEKWKDIPSLDEDVLSSINSIVDVVISLTETMTGDNVKPDVLLSNVNASKTALNTLANVFDGTIDLTTQNNILTNVSGTFDLIKEFSKLKPKNINDNATSLKSAISMITVEIEKDDAIIKKFDNTIVSLKDNISRFDEVLKDERGNRKRAMAEFKDNMEDLLSVFKDDNSTISNLSTLLSQFQNMDTSKIKQNVWDVKDAVAGNGNESPSRNAPVAETTQTTIIIDYDRIQSAVANAIDGMKLDKYMSTESTEHYRFSVDTF